MNKYTLYTATGWVCDIAAAHEIGETDVTIWPTKSALIRKHPYVKECGGAVKVRISYERPGWVKRWGTKKFGTTIQRKTRKAKGEA